MSNDELFSENREFLGGVRHMLKEQKRRPNDAPFSASEFVGLVRQDDVGVATKLCLQAGAQVDSVCEITGNTALLVACFRGFPSTVKVLIAAKADVFYVSHKNPMCPLWCAVQAQVNNAARGLLPLSLPGFHQLVQFASFMPVYHPSHCLPDIPITRL
jgi:ankyrin repeat protein